MTWSITYNKATVSTGYSDRVTQDLRFPPQLCGFLWLLLGEFEVLITLWSVMNMKTNNKDCPTNTHTNTSSLILSAR